MNKSHVARRHGSVVARYGLDRVNDILIRDIIGSARKACVFAVHEQHPVALGVAPKGCDELATLQFAQGSEVHGIPLHSIGRPTHPTDGPRGRMIGSGNSLSACGQLREQEEDSLIRENIGREIRLKHLPVRFVKESHALAFQNDPDPMARFRQIDLNG